MILLLLMTRLAIIRSSFSVVVIVCISGHRIATCAIRRLPRVAEFVVVASVSATAGTAPPNRVNHSVILMSLYESSNEEVPNQRNRSGSATKDKPSKQRCQC